MAGTADLNRLRKKFFIDAVYGSLKGFDPRIAVRNPVMFVVYISTVFVAMITFLPGLFTGMIGKGYGFSYYVAIFLILIATLWFANFSEAFADAQGKANAESLRSLKSETTARLLSADGRIEEVRTEKLRKGDIILLREGDTVPIDGQVVEGALVVNESMMTGESEPQVKETGGDKDSVLGGTTVVSGQGKIKVSNDPGSTFLDQMISLVEGANRQKTQNEMALSQLLVALSLVLVIVIATVIPVAAFFRFTVDMGALIALLVCLLPTTIGALLPAIRIAGVNRVVKYNVIAKSGKAVETSGDVDVLLLDKTGTITIGNRVATRIIPAPGKDEATVLRYAYLSSAMDTTPEGMSTMKLAYAKGARIDKSILSQIKPIRFTAETRMSGSDLGDERIRKGSADAMEKNGTVIPEDIRREIHSAAMEGSTPLLLAVNNEVLGLIILQDLMKPGIDARIHELKNMGIRTIMVTGDNFLTAQTIAKKSGVDEFRAEAKPQDKLEIITREQGRGHLIAMTGDGSNDAPALAQADVGLAMNSGTAVAKEAANMVDLDSDPTKLIEIVALGKQLLITRGALTTFSITNDVAKYFAIIPAMFAAYLPSLEAVNILGIQSPQIAILSTLLFNAIVIPMLIPIAMRGVRFEATGPIALLRRNIILYGGGGLLSAFVGIKLIAILMGVVLHV
ncbi:MAG: potassium-transporting ATPase subunit KdpB [Thermoplasmata archaeon YP2-bin.285]|uniref:Potassium-transporting ATPase ATP-binding subunit n=1 Tax=Candidatus Sysuiplasma superficiale TaxID=2823368 RepID=A0A8J7YMU9_9ARCH|nr:potassium-transporting ATPase subunit KdpB [Candidatus Sysuiplasma superficiale]